MEREEKAARNISRQGVSTVGHTGTVALFGVNNASGESTSTFAEVILSEQVGSLIEESSVF